MRSTLLIFTNEADRPEWGTPAGDAEAKGYDDFYGEITQRGVFRGGEPLQRVADATSVRVPNGDTQISDGPAVRSSEQLGGWYLLECDDLDQALELAAKIPGAGPSAGDASVTMTAACHSSSGNRRSRPSAAGSRRLGPVAGDLSWSG